MRASPCECETEGEGRERTACDGPLPTAPRPHKPHRLHTVGQTRRRWVTGATVAWGGWGDPAADATSLPTARMQSLGAQRLRALPACLHTGKRAGQRTQPRSPQRAPPPRTLGILQEPANRTTTARQHTHSTSPQIATSEGRRNTTLCNAQPEPRSAHACQTPLVALRSANSLPQNTGNHARKAAQWDWHAANP